MTAQQIASAEIAPAIRRTFLYYVMLSVPYLDDC